MQACPLPSPEISPSHIANAILPEDTIYTLVQGRHGLFLTNKNDIYIGGSLINYGEYSEQEWKLLEQVTPEGGVMIEVGAHLGAHTIPLCRKIGPKGKVFAFEPQPILFQNLCANLALNGFMNCYAFNQACGQDKGKLIIPDIAYTKQGNFGGIQLQWFKDCQFGQHVDIINLDSLKLKALNLLKLDVEGMEHVVLKGAQQTIKRCSPVIYAENHFEDSGKDVITFLLNNDYNIWQHTIPLYNKNNYFKNAQNIYGKASSFNIFCLPKKITTTIDLPQIKSVEDWDKVYASIR